MSFESPLFLLTLLVIPLAVALYVLAERRRMKYAIRFTNLDVLAGVVGSRFRRRFVPLALFLLALAALCVGMARPQHTTLVPRDRATVILVLDVSRSMEAKDNYIGGHTERVSDIAVGLAKRLGYTGVDLDAIQIGALMHDIGKIGIPESILHKPGPLDIFFGGETGFLAAIVYLSLAIAILRLDDPDRIST